MGRKTVYNSIVGEKYELVNKKNKDLLEEWVEYLHSVNRSDETIKQYINDFKIWAVWAHDKAEDRFFIEITKRDAMRFQAYCLTQLGHSSARVRRLRSTLSSLSNYVENILDEDFPSFRNIINKIEAPVLKAVREKTILSDEDVERTLEGLVEKGLYQQACYFALAAYSGARKAELLRFKVDYFKDEYMKDGLYKTPEKIVSKGRGKGGKEIYKYTIAKHFKPYLDLWLKERERLEIESDWLFVTTDKGKFIKAKTSTANTWIETIEVVLEAPAYSHMLRHYTCTVLSKAGIPAEAIRKYFSWESVEMINLYNDSDAEDDFGKYFGEDGVKQQEEKGLKDL